MMLTVAYGMVLLVGSFCGGLALPTNNSFLAFIAFLGFYIAGATLWMSLDWILKKASAWRYIRAFEAIAAKRPREGTV
jgi:hypothetical protein